MTRSDWHYLHLDQSRHRHLWANVGRFAVGYGLPATKMHLPRSLWLLLWYVNLVYIRVSKRKQSYHLGSVSYTALAIDLKGRVQWNDHCSGKLCKVET